MGGFKKLKHFYLFVCLIRTKLRENFDLEFNLLPLCVMKTETKQKQEKTAFISKGGSPLNRCN